MHRDLKARNILVSNQHYCNLSDPGAKLDMFLKRPVVCKLADFGESRSQLIQTAAAKTTVRKMLQTLFLLHNEWLYFAWNVCCLSRKLHYILKITSFLLSIFIVLLLQYSTLPKTASIYTAESFSSKSVFCIFYKLQSNSAI